MADRIKGITIEIDGDTKGLSNALKGVNKDIKSTQTQLKDVEKLLKLDPHNITLLSQKMELLGREIGQTKDKLSQLKSVTDQMNEGLKNGSVSVDQYEAWQREIIATEQELKGLEEQIKKVPTASETMIAKVSEDFEKLGGKISSVGDKVASLGDTMTATLTAGITAVGSASVVAWQEMDSALDNVIAKTGASGRSLEEMQDIINGIATSIPVDFATVSDAVAEVNTRFDVTGDLLSSLSTSFIEFSELNGTDVTGSIDQVSALMKAWGLNTSDTIGVLNTLNAVGQNTGASVSDLASLLQSNALSFKEMGYNVAEASVLLGNMEKNGVDASTGVNALRKAMDYAIKNGSSLNEVMAEWEALMGSNISETEKLARTEELFGTKAFSQLYTAIKEGNLSFTDINASMSYFSGSVKDTFNATLDPIDEFTTTLNDLKILGAEIGEEVIPVLVDVLRDLKPILDSLRDTWESMSPADQKKFIENMGKLALLGPALSGVGRAISGIGLGISALGKVGTMLSGLGLGAKITSLFSGGIGTASATSLGATLGTSLLAGLSSAFVGGAVGELIDHHIIAPIMEMLGSDSAEWYKNFTWFGEGGFFQELFDFNSLDEALDVYKGALSEMGADLKASMDDDIKIVSTGWTTISDATKKAWDVSVQNVETCVTIIKDILTNTWDAIVNSVTTLWDNIKATFNTIKDGIFETFQAVYDKIKGIWDSLGELFEAGFNIKLPHITVSGGVAPYGIGGQGSLPKFNVDWYANGGILTSPTIFGMQNGRLLGGGESGAEAVLPLSRLEEMIASGMSTALGSGGDTVINVSIDNNSLGSVILTAQQMQRLRSGK